jgi:hypothetical protein
MNDAPAPQRNLFFVRCCFVYFRQFHDTHYHTRKAQTTLVEYLKAWSYQ